MRVGFRFYKFSLCDCLMVAADSVPPNVDERSNLRLCFNKMVSRKGLSVHPRSAAQSPPHPFRLKPALTDSNRVR